MRKIIFTTLVIFGMQTFALETVKGAKKDIESFKTEISAQLDTFEKKIEELKLKAKDKSHVVKDETIQDLEASRNSLKSELNKLEDSSKNNWKKMRKGISDSVRALHGKIQKALND